MSLSLDDINAHEVACLELLLGSEGTIPSSSFPIFMADNFSLLSDMTQRFIRTFTHNQNSRCNPYDNFSENEKEI